jgi:hypothetical protein
MYWSNLIDDIIWSVTESGVRSTVWQVYSLQWSSSRLEAIPPLSRESLWLWFDGSEGSGPEQSWLDYDNCLLQRGKGWVQWDPSFFCLVERRDKWNAQNTRGVSSERAEFVDSLELSAQQKVCEAQVCFHWSRGSQSTQLRAHQPDYTCSGRAGRWSSVQSNLALRELEPLSPQAASRAVSLAPGACARKFAATPTVTSIRAIFRARNIFTLIKHGSRQTKDNEEAEQMISLIIFSISCSHNFAASLALGRRVSVASHPGAWTLELF